jgi:RNA polymerase sigma-70 factor, ECF subfamily
MNEALERDVRRACEAGELRTATTATLETYGPEVLGYLCGVAGNEEDAREVFAIFAEDLWNGIGGFRWACTLRGWVYTLARHALARFRADQARRVRRHAPVSAASQVAARVISTTPAYLASTARARLEALRAALEPGEQELLILRNDRGLSWPEIAQILHGVADLGDAARARESASLRKRHERLLKRLRALYEES